MSCSALPVITLIYFQSHLVKSCNLNWKSVHNLQIFTDIGLQFNAMNKRLMLKEDPIGQTRNIEIKNFRTIQIKKVEMDEQIPKRQNKFKNQKNIYIKFRI